MYNSRHTIAEQNSLSYTHFLLIYKPMNRDLQLIKKKKIKNDIYK